MERDGVQAERLDAKTLYEQLSVSSFDHAINSLLKIRDSIHHISFPSDEYLFSKEKNFRHCPFRYGFLLHFCDDWMHKKHQGLGFKFCCKASVNQVNMRQENENTAR